MQMASVIFPFRRIFRLLELERRWWHRFGVVFFFTVLLCASLYTAGVTFTMFAPPATMPVIQSGDIFDQVTAEQQLHPAIDDAATQPMIDPHGVVHQVAMDNVMEALKVGDQRVVQMIDPQEIRRWVPEDKIQTAIENGGRVAPSVALDMSTLTPLDKTVEMPDGSTSRFAGTMPDGTIQVQWNHAKSRRRFTAVLWAILLSITTALFINYLFQTLYRLLLYVIFGNRPTPPKLAS